MNGQSFAETQAELLRFHRDVVDLLLSMVDLWIKLQSFIWNPKADNDATNAALTPDEYNQLQEARIILLKQSEPLFAAKAEQHSVSTLCDAAERAAQTSE